LREERTCIDLTAKIFTVKEAVRSGNARQEIFHPADDGKVMLQDKTAHLGDLKVGDSVTVKSMENAGKNMAEECTIARKTA